MWNRIREEFFPKPDAFDLARGVKTSGLKGYPLRRLFTGRDYRRYQPINEEWFIEATEGLPRYTFLDMGCGRGRALILAHEAGFQKIIGVEFDPSLCEDARGNLRKLGIQGEVICQDAATFTLPSEPCIVFFYNPFGPHIMGQVLSHVRRDDLLVYVNPLEERLFRRFRVENSGEHFRVYSAA